MTVKMNRFLGLVGMAVVLTFSSPFIRAQQSRLDALPQAWVPPPAAQYSATQVTAVRAGRLFDPRSGTLRANQIIVMRGERIIEVGPNATIPAGARVIDLFAGSGALGMEALSRGASFTLFVDDGTEARALLRANVEALGLGGVTRIWRANATKLGKSPTGSRFTLAFLDPPYGKGLAGLALAALGAGAWLVEGALCIVEEAAKAEFAAPEGFSVADERIYGDTKIAFLRYEIESR